MKKQISVKLISCLLIFFMGVSLLLSGCKNNQDSTNPGSEKMKIVASLFPQYDFAKEIAKEKASVELLLPPGVESHSFDPGPSDILKLENSNIFLFTGENMEGWAKKIISGLNNKNLLTVDVSKNINLLKNDSEEEHEHKDSHHHHHDEHKHNHNGYDPHVWLDPTLAIVMVNNVKEAIIQKDPKNKDYYEKNALEYKEKLTKLDTDIKEVVKNKKRDTLVFSGRFAHNYFLKRYNLNYKATISTCAEEADPSTKELTRVINYINENNIPCVYYEESSLPKIAVTISEATKTNALRFNTLHNITKEELENRVNYVDFMYKNLENLKQGLL